MILLNRIIECVWDMGEYFVLMKGCQIEVDLFPQRGQLV